MKEWYVLPLSFGLCCLCCGGKGSGAASDASAGIDVRSACPLTCAGALRAVQASCPVDQVTCIETTSPGQLNDCYTNGVRAYWDTDGSGDLTQVTMIRPDGNICYVVAVDQTGSELLLTGQDSAGTAIITQDYFPDRLSTYACPDGSYFTDTTDHPCGALDTLPISQCTDGLCVRP